MLHEVLSEGLHEQPDEKCMESAERALEAPEFLVDQIGDTKTTSQRYTENMRKLCECARTDPTHQKIDLNNLEFWKRHGGF